MTKYIKHNSNYIKTVKHQSLKDGSTIFERDWVTIGGRYNFGPDKIPYYRDGNFIFTTSPFSRYQKKHKNGFTVATWTYEDVKNASSKINIIHLDEHTEDIRSYAYYGSCIELIRSSIENIIKTFPGNITISNENLSDEYEELEGYFLLNNPFDINLYIENIQLQKEDNPLHYLTYSLDKYQISTDNGETFNNITSYDVKLRKFYEKINSNPKEFEAFTQAEFEAEGAGTWIETNCVMYEWLPPYNSVYEVTINDNIKIYGFIINKKLISVTQTENIVIQPKDEIIEEYFNNLEGFEKQLLKRDTTPLYTNRFVTPIEYNLDYVYFKRTYTWPSNGYCIDITSTKYFEFIQDLSKTAELFDELWTDNLWRRMTHEAIKNYDWTYTREYENGEEEDNVDGGERMHKVINIIGRVFDDTKRIIDTIKRNNRTTYDKDRNIPNALLNKKLEIRGWDIFSTIPTYEINDNGETKIISASQDTLTNFEKWYPTLNPNKMTFADVDIEFMRRLMLSTRRIFETKGTRQSIDMIMGMFGYGNMNEENYTITEEYFTVTPREYDEDIHNEEEETLGECIVRLNSLKGNEFLYNEDASGIPVESFAVFEKNEETQRQEPTTYLIPFYNQNKIYDGNFYFQSKGGWFYNKENDETEINPYNWTETLSYLHVCSHVKDLLNVHPNSVSIGDIYYVVNINDYIEFTEEPIYSNFFVLEDEFNPENFYSWTNLDLSGDIYTEENGYTQDTENTQGTITKYKNYVQKAIYLDNIIPYTIGNNPHVGYGKYDLGNEYLEYMKQPFKYSIDTNNFEDINAKEEAETIEFQISEPNLCENNNEKIKIFADGVKTTDIGNYCELKDLTYKTYDLDKIIDLSKNTYYLNCKVIHFKNKIENNEYKKYFKNVIMNYLMQIIPSTAIFVLENFNITE